MKNNVKRRINTRKILSRVLILAGVLLIAIPAVITYFNTKRNNDVIVEFLRQSEAAASNIHPLEDVEVEAFYIPLRVKSCRNARGYHCCAGSNCRR